MTLDRLDAGLTLDRLSPAWKATSLKRSREKQLTLDRTLDSRRTDLTLDSRLSLRGGTAWRVQRGEEEQAWRLEETLNAGTRPYGLLSIAKQNTGTLGFLILDSPVKCLGL